MDQNQPADNDLQKAIDDIANTTNQDPVFSDPVAAPSSVPEGDTGELAEAIGPFPAPEPAPVAPAPTVEMVAPAPEPIAPIEEIAIPSLEVPAPAPAPAPEPIMPAFEPAPTPVMPAFEPAPVAQGLDTRQVKQAALRDLIPLVDHLNMNPSQKFNFYRNIFDDLHDYTVLEPAYLAAKEIADDTERAEALLYLVESIDKM
ncbi:hypothetical protein IJI89_03660 [Candidatus Saccharibacteria bacterium]|nr:hypothetical protein [Candidatus Saccharibacteria bacterium]